MGDYIKDAYKKIYRHPKWAEEARAYENNLAVALYKNPYVQQASQDALRRVSEVLTAFYTGKEGAGTQTETKLGSAEELSAGVEQLSGQKSDTSSAEKAAQANEAAKEALATEQEEREAGPEGGIAVNDILTKAFLNPDANSAGQIDTGNPADRAGLVDAVLNQDGNLREKMTMLFNATVYNAGRTAESTNSSFTLKRMFEQITDKEARGSDALKNLDMKTIKSLRGGDIYATGRLADKVGKRSYSSMFSAWRGFSSRKRRKAKKDGEPQGLGLEYYEQRGIGPSEREAALAAPVGPDGKRQALSWREGVATLKMDKDSKWVQERRNRGFQLIAGPSGTTMRMLGAYKLLGASREQLLAFRLALIAWMGTSQDHSLYEILYGSKLVGVQGKEDLSEAAKTYMTVDPLTPPQLRSMAAKEGEFPHERVFSAMLEELEKQRADFGKAHGEDELPSDMKPEKGLVQKDAESHLSTGQDKALNIYTTGAYQIMNQSMKFGKKIGWWLAARKLKNTYLEAKRRMEQGKSLDDMEGIEEIYNDATYEEVTDEKMSKSIRSNIRIASAMSLEALRERSQYHSVGADRDEGHDKLAAEGNLGEGYARGVAYRGLGIMRWFSDFKEGSTITLSSLTSTSRSKDTAISFYRKVKSKFRRPVLATYYLTNKSAVDISDTSIYGEDEVLLPRGAKFRVKTGLHLKDEMNQVELEEVAAPQDRSNMVEENPDIAASLPPAGSAREPDELSGTDLSSESGTLSESDSDQDIEELDELEEARAVLNDKEQDLLYKALHTIDVDGDCMVTRNALEDLFPGLFTSAKNIVASLSGQLTEDEKNEILRQSALVVNQLDTGAYDFLLPMENIIRNHFPALAAAI